MNKKKVVEDANIKDTSVSVGNGRFSHQNVIQDRKSSTTQIKLMILWWNKKFLKAYDLLLLSTEKKIELDFGHGLCWPSFCPNRVLKEQFLKVLGIFFQNYSIVKDVIHIKFPDISKWKSAKKSKVGGCNG